MEPDLFSESGAPYFSYIESCIARLAHYKALGYAFLRPLEVSQILDVTLQSVRNEVKLFKLDAYYICGHLRIDLGSLESYINKDYERDVALSRMIENTALSGVYELTRYGKLDRIKDEINQKHLPVTIVDDLLDRANYQKYDSMSNDSGELIDWYGIDQLPIPDKITVGDLAELLRVPGLALAEDMNVDPYTTLTFPDVYDYLTVKQLLNASIPFSLNISQKIFKISGQDTQLFLDL